MGGGTKCFLVRPVAIYLLLEKEHGVLDEQILSASRHDSVSIGKKTFLSFKRIVIAEYNAFTETLAQRHRLFLTELQNLEELNLIKGGASRSKLNLNND